VADEDLHLIDVNSGNLIECISRAHSGEITQCIISPSSSMIATTGADKKLKLWKLPTV